MWDALERRLTYGWFVGLPRARDTAFEMILGERRYGFSAVERLKKSLVPKYVFARKRGSTSCGGDDPLSDEHLLSEEAGQLESALGELLDCAIDSEKRTGAAMERLAGTLAEMRAWVAERLEAAPSAAGA
ncbi:MAG TPA: hypothetical protein VF092_09570 [Longimicrobium sp.]